MDYRKTAQQICDNIGGRKNIISAEHCATRLRLVIGDNDKCSKEAIRSNRRSEGRLFCARTAADYFRDGTVNKVYDEFIQIAGISAASTEEVRQAAGTKMSFWRRAVKTLGDVFIPIIPAIVASGLLVGILEGLCEVYPAMEQSGTYTILHLFSNAAFVFCRS